MYVEIALCSETFLFFGWLCGLE